MMIAKTFKLSTKEVNYLLRRKQSIHVMGYKVLRHTQYPNLPYHQTGIQLSAKVHKSSVQRNAIRRAYYAAWYEYGTKNKSGYKIFVLVHPEYCKPLLQLLSLTSNSHTAMVKHFSQLIVSAIGKIPLTSKPTLTKYNFGGRKSEKNQT